MVDEKRERYPPTGGELVPMVFEASGRASEDAEEFSRAYGHGLTLGGLGACAGNVMAPDFQGIAGLQFRDGH
jgi:hypothetical protein